MARVLLLDDEPSIRFVISEILEDAGFETVVVESGELALEQLRQGEPVDIIMVDLLMRGMTGKEFLNHVRAVPAWANIPAILMTGAVYARDIFPAPASYQAMLQKPFKLRDVVETVEGVLSIMPAHSRS